MVELFYLEVSRVGWSVVREVALPFPLSFPISENVLKANIGIRTFQNSVVRRCSSQRILNWEMYVGVIYPISLVSILSRRLMLNVTSALVLNLAYLLSMDTRETACSNNVKVTRENQRITRWNVKQRGFRNTLHTISISDIFNNRTKLYIWFVNAPCANDSTHFSKERMFWC